MSQKRSVYPAKPTRPLPVLPKWAEIKDCISLWHGTSTLALDSILKGVDPSFGERRRDFGRGFYTTTYEVQAREWAAKITRKEQLRRRDSTIEGAAILFRVPLIKLAPLHTLAFVRPDHDNQLFWGFVCHCRGCPEGKPPDPQNSPTSMPTRRMD